MTALVAASLASAAALVAGARVASVRRASGKPPPSADAVAGVLLGTTTVAALLVVRAPTAAPLAIAGVAVLVGALRRRSVVRRLRAARGAEVVEFCFACAAELRAGRTPADAVAGVALQLPLIGEQLAGAARAARLGAVLAHELAVVADVPGCDRLRSVAAAWSATDSSGARAADLLERVGSAFVADDAGRADLQVHVAGPQATVVVLAVLPLMAVAFGSAIGAAPTTFLLHNHIGWALTLAAVALDIVGVAWMRRIMRRALAA